MAEFSSTEDITLDLATFIQKAENLKGLNYHETKTLTRKQDDFFTLHQILNTTLETTLSDEIVRNENIINPDIVNMVSGLTAYNNQIIDMNEVDKVSWFCPKVDAKIDVLEETPTYIVDSDKFGETQARECPESKSLSEKDEENSSYITDEESQDCTVNEVEDILNPLAAGEITNQAGDDGERNSENINKSNLVRDSNSSETGVNYSKEGSNSTVSEESELVNSNSVDVINSNQSSHQTLSEVINEDQQPASSAAGKEKLSIFKRIFKRKKKI